MNNQILSLAADPPAGRPHTHRAEPSLEIPRYYFDSRDYINFKKNVKFISSEWGTEIDLVKDEQEFRSLMEERARSLQTNSPSLTFKDISNLFLQRFKLSMEEKKMIRFMDAENYKIITKRDYLIYSRSVQQPRHFIIQIGKTELINPQEIGVEKDSQQIIE